MKIMLLDDNPYDTKMLENNIRHYLSQVDIVSFNDMDSALDFLGQNDVDAIFLDVCIDGREGMEIATYIHQQNRDTLLIYVSDHLDQVLKCIGLKTLKFIEKKKLKETIEDTLNQLRKYFSCQNKKIIFSYLNEKQMIALSNILYVKKNHHHVDIIYLNKLGKLSALRTQKSLLWIEEQLNSGFMKIDRGVIVNYPYIEKMDQQFVWMTNGICFDISRRRKRSVQQWFLQQKIDTDK